MSKNGMFTFGIIETIAIFCFFVSDFWQFSAFFKKPSSRLRFNFIEALFWLKLLVKTATSHRFYKKSLTIVLKKKFCGEETHFLKI